MLNCALFDYNITMKQLILIAHDVRSCHNVGSMLRTADGIGVETVYLTGYTPYPKAANDTRLPHIAARVTKQIQKTSLGAETTVNWRHAREVGALIQELKDHGFNVFAIEQSHDSVPLPSMHVPAKTALVVGNEVDGIDEATLTLCDKVVEIPMLGQKESYNVGQAAAIALYHCRYF